jgi:hypothetical protein
MGASPAYNYASYELCLVSEFVDVADALGDGWVFRGQSDATWDIASSLEREAGRLQNPDLASREAAMLKQVKLAPYINEDRGPDPEGNFSWLALLQHHGGKTRLVDFTRSFYVALYFAVRDCPGQDAAVWSISTCPLDARIAEIREQNDFELSDEEAPRRFVNNAIEWPDRYQGDDRLAIAYAESAQLNQRLIAQQGLFLCPLNLSESFMVNLSRGLGLTGTKEPPKRLSSPEELQEEARNGSVVKIRVPHDQHRNLLFHLRRMNITDATLFPGLDGFARSLNYFAMGVE